MNNSVSVQTPQEEPHFNFSLIIIGILIALAFYGCKSTQRLAVTEKVTHDTCYLTNFKYDSIYIDNSHYIDRGKDTVIIRDKTTEFRYHLLHDTIKVITNDSIPYEVKVIETKTERYTPWYAKVLAFIGFLLILWYAFKLVIYFIRKSA